MTRDARGAAWGRHYRSKKRPAPVDKGLLGLLKAGSYCVYLRARPEVGWPKPGRSYWVVSVGICDGPRSRPRRKAMLEDDLVVRAYWPVGGRVRWVGSRKLISHSEDLASGAAVARAVLSDHCSPLPPDDAPFYFRTHSLDFVIGMIDRALQLEHVLLP